MADSIEAYLVGGAVRDQLLGLPVSDRDWVVVGATPQQMLDLGYTQVGRDFPVFLHPQTHEEYALARTERKQGAGHRGFVVSASVDVTLELDLLRRDLTINAIAMTANGEIIDPYGGQNDLEQKCLRHVSDAFAEDPLRVFRLARFAAQLQDFVVAPETMALAKSMVARGELQTLSAERVWQECHKALTALAPERFFNVLHECGGLQDWFAELIGSEPRFITRDGVMRYTELPLTTQQFAGLSQRLKVPREIAQSAQDWCRWGQVVHAWESVSAAQLGEAFDYLKAPHDGKRALWLAQRVFYPASVPAELIELISGYGDVVLGDEVPPGPEYGKALRRARIEWLDQVRAR